MPNHKIKAIILKRINLGEADRIVTAFSFENGKIKFVAKGVRRTKSKLAGSIEPFCLVDLQVSDGKNLNILTAASILNNYLGLTPELEELKLANYMGEVVDKVVPDETPVSELFSLIDEVLGSIKHEAKNRLKSYFLAKLFEILGLSPETEVCLKCSDKPQERLYISNEGGGILDENCCLYFADSQEIDTTSVKFLRFLKHHNLKSVLGCHINEKNVSEALTFLEEYLRYVSHRTFKSDLI